MDAQEEMKVGSGIGRKMRSRQVLYFVHGFCLRAVSGCNFGIAEMNLLQGLGIYTPTRSSRSYSVSARITAAACPIDLQSLKFMLLQALCFRSFIGLLPTSTDAIERSPNRHSSPSTLHDYVAFSARLKPFQALTPSTTRTGKNPTVAPGTSNGELCLPR